MSLDSQPSTERDIPLQIRATSLRLGDMEAKFVFPTGEATKKAIMQAIVVDGAYNHQDSALIPKKEDDIKFYDNPRDPLIKLEKNMYGFTGVEVKTAPDGQYILSLQKRDTSGWTGAMQLLHYKEILGDQAEALVLPLSFEPEIDTPVHGLEYPEKLGVQITQEDLNRSARRRREGPVNPPETMTFADKGLYGLLSTTLAVPVEDPRVRAAITIMAKGEYTASDDAFHLGGYVSDHFYVNVLPVDELRYSTDPAVQKAVFDTASKLTFKQPGFMERSLGLVKEPPQPQSRRLPVLHRLADLVKLRKSSVDSGQSTS